MFITHRQNITRKCVKFNVTTVTFFDFLANKNDLGRTILYNKRKKDFPLETDNDTSLSFSFLPWKSIQEKK